MAFNASRGSRLKVVKEVTMRCSPTAMASWHTHARDRRKEMTSSGGGPTGKRHKVAQAETARKGVESDRKSRVQLPRR